MPRNYDQFFYKSRPYELAASERTLALPLEQYGVHPDFKNPLTGAGATAEFAVTDGLYLKNVGVSVLDGHFPPINGVSPCAATGSYAFYQDVNLKLDYTGKLLLGRKSNHFHSYRKTNGQWPWAFRTLREFTFENGKLVKVKNYSRLARRMCRTVEKVCRTPEQLLALREGGIDALPREVQDALDPFCIPIWWLGIHLQEAIESVEHAFEAFFANLARSLSRNGDDPTVL